MERTSIIKSIIFAAVALAAGIFPERSEHCEAMSREGCAWAKTETIGGYSWAYRINGDTAENYGIMNKLKNLKEWKHGKTGIIFRHNPFNGKGGL